MTVDGWTPMTQPWWTDVDDIRNRLNEVDLCLNRGSLSREETESLMQCRRLLHKNLIDVQLATFDYGASQET